VASFGLCYMKRRDGIQDDPKDVSVFDELGSSYDSS